MSWTALNHSILRFVHNCLISNRHFKAGDGSVIGYEINIDNLSIYDLLVTSFARVALLRASSVRGDIDTHVKGFTNGDSSTLIAVYDWCFFPLIKLRMITILRCFAHYWSYATILSNILCQVQAIFPDCTLEIQINVHIKIILLLIFYKYYKW